MNYELIIKNNIVQLVRFDKDNEVNAEDITDINIIKRIDEVNKWLKIHPLDNYILNESEYESYKEFMTDERYGNTVDEEDTVSPIVKALKEFGIDVEAIKKKFNN